MLSRLDADLKPPESFAQLKHLEILSWLIQNQYLDIKIAIPLKENGLPEDSTQQLDPQHIFHEKVGIFTDSKGEKLAFNGSNNESIGGWERNVESFHVYCSWGGGRELDRVEEVARFEQLWYDVSPNVRVFEVPEAVQKKLLRYAKSTKPDWNAQAEFDSRPLTKELTEPEAQPEPELKPDSSAISTELREEERLAFTQLANIHKHPGCLDFCLKSIPIHPWPHQIKILRRVAQNFPQSFLIADEVGLGKTIETGLILRYLLLSKKVKRVLILAPASVQPHSGRGGELYQNGEWCLVPKEEIKRRFRQDEIKILLCTESASEGLNLQNCGVLINYDMPWNPMRVEQRIGRIDRIGQRYPTVRIHNFYYDGTVEAKVYRKLRDRINAFATVVGNLQPILAQVPTFIERAVMSADPEEEDVLMSQFDSVLDSPPPRLAIEEMVAMDLEADLVEIQKPITSTPLTPETIEQLFTDSAILKASGVQFERRSERTWQLNYKGQNYMITFYPNIFDEIPSLRLINFGDHLFEEIIKAVII
ncbi:helicase-related protein [Nostoc punctiforme UO1]|uniref:helicase-related protein n=1 Tax=Nostoc punctiforme TaxID=272131 RepID=UPI003099CD84